LNFDSRGEEYLPGLREAISDEDLYRINGNTLGKPYSLPKLMWVKQHQPDLYQRTDQFLHWGAFVPYMLGAEACIDFSLANRTLLFDLEKGDWSEALLKLAGIDGDKLLSPFLQGR
jgi:xylulokinase